ncbi:hypothetical protein GCM10022243_01550 [Saccharothrix violaceirubra]|uniref:Uncharacterized protein n=1 Tax=Saccharothrix violaceirubra TaxID=413306 RepID=A0A7W7WWA0_9PSEU|nr:hypothetical protein [Saccharothrix violaceirubra]MBB4965343.1 hypothetical protein [Saccharothrix violaceirubra]
MLTAALDYLRPGDLLTVQEFDPPGRNLLEGLLALDSHHVRPRDPVTVGHRHHVPRGIAHGCTPPPRTGPAVAMPDDATADGGASRALRPPERRGVGTHDHKTRRVVDSPRSDSTTRPNHLDRDSPGHANGGRDGRSPPIVHYRTIGYHHTPFAVPGSPPR